MTLTIFVGEKDFTCLTRTIPVGSHSKQVLAHAVRFTSVAGSFSPGNYIVSCEESEARNLLMYARGECPGAAASIVEACRAVGLAPE